MIQRRNPGGDPDVRPQGPRRHAPGELEAEVLRHLREASQPVTGRQLWEGFAAPGAPARTTVLTVLSRLEHKGLVRRLEQGGVARFEAVRPEPAVVAAQMEALLARASDRQTALAQFAGLLDPADLRTLTDRPGSAR